MDIGGQLAICHIGQSRPSAKLVGVDPETKEPRYNLVARYLNLRVSLEKLRLKRS